MGLWPWLVADPAGGLHSAHSFLFLLAGLTFIWMPHFLSMWTQGKTILRPALGPVLIELSVWEACVDVGG